MSILALASGVSRSNPNCRVSPSSPAQIDNCFPKWVCSRCEGKTVWITSSGMALQRVACLRLLCYKIPTKVSQFSVLTVPFPQAGCECPAFEIAMDWHLAAALRGKLRKAAIQAGDLLGRRVKKECRFAKKSSFSCLLKKNPLFSPSRLPQSVHILKFRFQMACVRNVNNGPFQGSAWPPVVAVSPSSPPGNSFSSSQFELFEMDLSGVEVELPAMRESRCWEGWIPLRCREQKHSLSS